MPPIRRIEHVDQPLVMRRHTPDTSRQAALIQRGGEQLADLSLRKGSSRAQLFDRLWAIFSGYQEMERNKQATAASMGQRVRERSEDKAEREAEREAERTARLTERRLALQATAEAKAETEAKDVVMDTPVGPISDTDPKGRVLAQLVQRFPSLAGRFGTTPRLESTPLGMGREVEAPPLLTRTPTQVESRQMQTDAAAEAARASASADRAADNTRQDHVGAETRRHNRVMENKPAAAPIPVIVQTPQGPAVLNRQTREAQPITMAGETVGVTPTAAERMDSRKFSKAAPVLKGIGELSERINTLNGVLASASGVAEKQKAKINLSDDVAEYEALVSGFTPMIARALGHTGVLTEQDVQSVKVLFPRPEDSKALRDRKINRMMTIIGELEGVEGVTPAAKPADPVDALIQKYTKPGGGQ